MRPFGFAIATVVLAIAPTLALDGESVKKFELREAPTWMLIAN